MEMENKFLFAKDQKLGRGDEDMHDDKGVVSMKELCDNGTVMYLDHGCSDMKLYM